MSPVKDKQIVVAEEKYEKIPQQFPSKKSCETIFFDFEGIERLFLISFSVDSVLIQKNSWRNRMKISNQSRYPVTTHATFCINLNAKEIRLQVKKIFNHSQIILDRFFEQFRDNFVEALQKELSQKGFGGYKIKLFYVK